MNILKIIMQIMFIITVASGYLTIVNSICHEHQTSKMQKASLICFTTFLGTSFIYLFMRVTG